MFRGSGSSAYTRLPAVDNRIVSAFGPVPGRLAGAVRVRGAVGLQRLRGPRAAFRSESYVRLNQRRQEHLAALGLPLAGRSVLEVGAGVGDHTSFLLDRECRVTVTDGRPANVEELRRRFGGESVRLLDLDRPDPSFDESFEIVYCYGTLYHLSRPAEAIDYLAARCNGMMLVETCVSIGDHEAINPEREPASSASQATSGLGCRPTRPWVRNRLRMYFPHVYATTTQPWHEEFPTDWTQAPKPGPLTRSIFVASRAPLALPSLTDDLPQIQSRA